MTENEDRNQKQEELAARALQEADVLLLVTGAGFSADSGLAVYNDIGKVEAYQLRMLDYADICQPKWMDQEPALFYGFWGQCFNDYRETKPHDGYQILKNWRDDKSENDVAKEIRSRIQHRYRIVRPFDEEETLLSTPYKVDHEDPSQIAGSFFAYTSNVDAHHYDVFGAHEIHDCHGNIEIWNCSDSECTKNSMWRAPLDFEFAVNKETMLAPELKEDNSSMDTSTEVQKVDNDDESGPAKIGHIKASGEKRANVLQYMPPGLDPKGWKKDGTNGNWPRCGHCDALARPSILMFGDFGRNFRYDLAQDFRWDYWEDALLDLVKRKSDKEGIHLKVCILEIGCGMNVPTCRNLSETTMQQLVMRGGDPTLIRINPDFPEFPNAPSALPKENIIPIRSRGLESLRRIDKVYKSLVGSK